MDVELPLLDSREPANCMMQRSVCIVTGHGHVACANQLHTNAVLQAVPSYRIYECHTETQQSKCHQ